MIQCPNCTHLELNGSLYCSECGAQLSFSEPLSTHSIYRSQSDGLVSQSVTSTPPPSTPVQTVAGESLVTLQVLDSSKAIPLTGRNEYTLGRVAEGQPILPDVDLSPYDAYAMGVSRLHAALKLSDRRVFLVDLGSSNGTRVNGEKLAANVDYPLNHGDLLTLGKLKLQILIRR